MKSLSLPLSAAAASICIGLCSAASPTSAQPPGLPHSPAPLRIKATPHLNIPPLEVESAVAESTNPFSGKVDVTANAVGQQLLAPVTINANTSADALTATQTGSGRALNGVINNANSALTALKGTTNGKGAAVGGLNSGTTGPGAQFQVTNAGSKQPGLVVTTAGTGNAIQAISTGSADTPAILGQNNGVSKDGLKYGIGIEGDGNYIGVHGSSPYIAIFGETTGSGTAISGTTDSGTGVFGTSYDGKAIEGFSAVGSGIYGESIHGVGVYGVNSVGTAIYGTSGSGMGVVGINDSGAAGVYGVSEGLGVNSYGVQGYSGHYAGIYGQSGVAIGVFGQSDTGIGVVGQSRTNYAGVFHGSVVVDNILYTKGLSYTSDRDQKQDFTDIDSAEVLNRIAAMSVTAWGYKTRPAERHIGPMAQDFHAAFRLGSDDRHIDVIDAIGVSLAAIQELHRQLKQKDAQLTEQGVQLSAQSARIASLEVLTEARISALEQAVATGAVARAGASSP